MHPSYHLLPICAYRRHLTGQPDVGPAVRWPPPIDAYADAVDSSGLIVINPANALGAPDTLYATVAAGLGNNLVLDLGAGEEGTGDLTVHYGALAVGVVATVDFLDASRQTISSGTMNLVSLSGGQATVTYSSAPPPIDLCACDQCSALSDRRCRSQHLRRTTNGDEHKVQRPAQAPQLQQIRPPIRQPQRRLIRHPQRRPIRRQQRRPIRRH